MIDETLINDPLTYYTLRDPMKNPMGIVDERRIDLQYHHSMIDSDNVNDSIKVRVLYNELMTLKEEFSNTERKLLGELSYLNADHRRLVEENKKLEDEITSIKQALYFG